MFSQPPSQPPSYNVTETLTSINITPEIVLEKLKGLNPNKTSGHDQWHPYFLREIAEEICEPLSILLNKSLKEGTHSSWLKAVITALHKKGMKSDPGNYRPVSMTPVSLAVDSKCCAMVYYVKVMSM